MSPFLLKGWVGSNPFRTAAKSGANRLPPEGVVFLTFVQKRDETRRAGPVAPGSERAGGLLSARDADRTTNYTDDTDKAEEKQADPALLLLLSSIRVIRAIRGSPSCAEAGVAQQVGIGVGTVYNDAAAVRKVLQEELEWLEDEA
jgi:hypothetical protein